MRKKRQGLDAHSVIEDSGFGIVDGVKDTGGKNRIILGTDAVAVLLDIAGQSW